MAITDFDTLIGKLEIASRPASLVFGKPWDFVQILCRILKVSFPIGRGSKFVVTGFETPGADDVDKLWSRTDRNLNPYGWYSYVKGKWRRFYTPIPHEIRWIEGDSLDPPEGWQVIDTDTAEISSSVVQKLKAQYVTYPGETARYVYYAVRYVGY